MITLFNTDGEAVNVQVDSPELKELRERNQVRLAQAKEKMGAHYLLHPSNMKQRLTQPR